MMRIGPMGKGDVWWPLQEGEHYDIHSNREAAKNAKGVHGEIGDRVEAVDWWADWECFAEEVEEVGS